MTFTVDATQVPRFVLQPTPELVTAGGTHLHSSGLNSTMAGWAAAGGIQQLKAGNAGHCHTATKR